MSEHRWSLIRRTISNGKIGSAASIMLNTVSIKISTPVRPTPALERRKTKQREVKRMKEKETKISRDLTQRRDRSMCVRVCLWRLICMLGRVWIRLRSRYNFSTGWIISPDISFTRDRSKFSLGSYELWTPHSEASKFSYG